MLRVSPAYFAATTVPHALLTRPVTARPESPQVPGDTDVPRTYADGMTAQDIDDLVWLQHNEPMRARYLQMIEDDLFGSQVFQERLGIQDGELSHYAAEEFARLLDERVDLQQVYTQLGERVRQYLNQNKHHRYMERVPFNRGELLARRYGRIIKELGLEPTQVLDVGFGDGVSTTRLGRRLGLDSLQMHGLEAVNGHTLEERFNAHYYDGLSLPRTLPRPDVIILNHVLHHFKDEAQIVLHLQQLYARLAPGGAIIISDVMADDPQVIRANRVLHRLAVHVAGLYPEEMPLDQTYLDKTGWDHVFAQAQVPKGQIRFRPPRRNSLENTSVMVLRKPH